MVALQIPTHITFQPYETTFRVDVKNGNYDGASDTVITTYLDNFEYLEPSIDKYDHNLKLTIEPGISNKPLREGSPTSSDIIGYHKQKITMTMKIMIMVNMKTSYRTLRYT
jgi:hypothetical protein